MTASFGTTRSYLIAFNCLLFLLVVSCPAQARTSDDELYNRGELAYNRYDYVSALMYLFAYKERDPSMMREHPNFARDVDEAIDYSRNQLQNSLNDLSELRSRLASQSRNGIGSSVSGLTAAPPQLHRPLVKPVQLSPLNGQVFHNYPRRTTLRWRPVRGAASYSIEIDCFHCCVSGKWCTETGVTYRVVKDIVSTNYTFNFAGAQPGRWRVWAVDNRGRSGPKSPWQKFEYTR